MDVIWVNRNDAEKIWPQVEPFLISALKRWLPVYFSCDLLEMVLKDEMQLWIIVDQKEERLYGAGLTSIRQYPRARMMDLFMLGGREMKKWRDKWEAAMDLFAKSQQCDFMQASGRSGWASFKGAFQSAVIVNKVLT